MPRAMRYCWIVFGYGVPEDIFKDEQYAIYLKIAFNRLFEKVTQAKNSPNVHVLFCGGKTDLFPPYYRTEAAEMFQYWKMLASRPAVKKITRGWLNHTEKRSLSTLENLLFSKQTVQKLGKIDTLFITCEQTRAKRVAFLAKKIYPKLKTEIIPIDFDNSPIRYDIEAIREKEKIEIKHMEWALRKPQNLQKHHRLFEEKIAFLRSGPREERFQQLKKKWVKKLKELIENSYM